MSEQINLPTIFEYTTQQEVDGEKQDITIKETQMAQAKLVDMDTTKKVLIKSLPYLPDFLRDKAVMKDASILLDALLQSKEQVAEELENIQQKYNEEGEGKQVIPVDWSLMDEIYCAYCDTLYKLPGYTNLSYEARIALIEENGFDYVLNLLLHIYDDEYKDLIEKYKEGSIDKVPEYSDFVKSKSDQALTRLTALFCIINMLKGTTAGLELVLRIINCPNFLYITWDTISNYRGQLTITDETKGIPVASSKLMTGTTEPTWGEKNVTDNNVIWRRVAAKSGKQWKPQMDVNYGDIVEITNEIGHTYYYKAVEINKGDVYIVVGENSTLQYIFNGVAWHTCSDYKAYSSQRERFTAILDIGNLGMSGELQTTLETFVRHYMLPYIEVTLSYKQSFPSVLTFPTGYGLLEIGRLFANYIDEQGNLVHKNLSAQVNERWGTEQKSATSTLTVGNPTFNERGFQGNVDLNKSFVQDPDGTIHPLYSKEFLTMPDEITGTARDKYNENGEITDYDGDYLQTPLNANGFVDLDFYIREQQNPQWLPDQFIRDVLVKIYRALTVYGVDHMSVKKLNETQIKDFYETIEEVYGGRATNVKAESKKLHINTGETYTRERTGIEGPYNLIFSDYVVKDNAYTGIGDIGILGSNEYFIYNGMLMKAQNDGYQYLDGEDNYTDVGASNVNPDYRTPAIKDGLLYYIENDNVIPMKRDNNTVGGYKTHYQVGPITVEGIEELNIDELSLITLNGMTEYADFSYWTNIEFRQHNWTHVTGFINKHYTAFGICDGRLYSIYLLDETPVFTMLDEDQGWTYITGAYYFDTYKAYGIKNGVLYTIGETITPLTYDGQPLTGWDGSFDCVSRYHHSNNLITTYGICNGNLYSIQEDQLQLIDEGNWTAICGYYNDESPRTFGYGIKNKALYEIRDNQIILRNDELKWFDISGCSTTTNTFVLGLAKIYDTDPTGYIYKIKDGTCEKLLEEGGWTDVFGRYTTSRSANANCFGYGVKDGKLYLLHRELTNPISVSGDWKLDGEGGPVDLLDYHITNISIVIDGVLYTGQNEIIKHIPTGPTDDPSNYDIIVNYETIGFNNDARYNIRTEHTFSQHTFIDPIPEGEHHRDGISFEHMNGEFNTSTGLSNSFINCPVVIHGTRKINGAGEAYDFCPQPDAKDKFGTYLELPNLGYYTVEFDYDDKHYGPYRFNKTKENIQFIEDNEFLYNIPQDEPEISSYTTRLLNIWDANFERDINYLLTIRDEYSITVTTEETPDSLQEFVVQFGCIGTTDEMKPIILDKDSEGLDDLCNSTGIFFGNQTIAIRDINNTLTTLYNVSEGDYLMPFIKFTQSGNNYNVYKSLDGINYTNTEKQVKEPKFLGGNGVIFGDSIILLASSYMDTSLGEHINLFENGYYVSVNNDGRDVHELVITGDNQEVQKVAEIQTETGRTVLSLDMDTLYTSMEHECSNEDLTVTDTFTYNKLNVGFHEGIDTATLTYSGKYVIDPEKANEVGNIGNYDITRKASNFGPNNYLNINPENQDPLVITTKEGISEQHLFGSEEDSVETNKYLLTSQISGEYDGDVQMRLVNSGELYEVVTDKPGVITKTLEYNSERFIIDEDRIYGVDRYGFNDYTAVLDFNDKQIDGYDIDDEEYSEDVEPAEEDYYVTIPIDLDNGTQLQDGSIDTLPVLCINTVDNIKVKVAQFDKQEIKLGNITRILHVIEDWYTMSGDTLAPMTTTPVYDEEEETYIYNGQPIYEDSYVEIGDKEYLVYKDEDENSYYLYKETQEELIPDVNPPYTFDEFGQELWWKFNVAKTFNGLNTSWVTEHNSDSPDPKDRLIYDEGKVHNFTDENNFTVNEIKNTNGFVFTTTTSDDTSINQGILNCLGVGSLVIKNDLFCWIDSNGEHYSEITAYPDSEYTFAFRNLREETIDESGKYSGDDEDPANRNTINTANIYYCEDDGVWYPLFDIDFRIDLTNVSEYKLGYANCGIEYLPFLGTIDLTKTWVENVVNNKIEQTRFFLVTQITKLYLANEKEGPWTLYQTLETPYSVWEYNFGYEFTGTMDMYESKLLVDYTLNWVDNKTNLMDTIFDDGEEQIRNKGTVTLVLEEAGIEVPIEDGLNFGLDSYGIQLTGQPKRWDTITVTYTTVDNAYYLQDNMKYYIKFNTSIDTESGKCLLERDGDATWRNGVISNFSVTDNYNMDLDDDYIVIKFRTGNITTLQGICGYSQDNSKSIVIENKQLKLFDDTDYFVLLDELKANKNYWIKLYSTYKPIEISTDGETWIQTESLPFGNYVPFVIGNGYTDQGRKEFLGSIDLKECYISKDDVITYLYKPYKRITPRISLDNVNYTNLSLLPLLTTDFITFGKQFDGELDLYESNLFLSDTVYWKANQIKVYNSNDELVDTFILDKLEVAPGYWKEEEYIRVNPEDLTLTVTGLPEIGDTIKLTYNTWYLFRENNTRYNLNITYDDDYCYVSYNKENDYNKYVLFTTYKRNYVINTGYQFNGRLSYWESTRAGLPLCDWYTWDTYEINYKEYGTDTWYNWTTFSVNQNSSMVQQCGFDLNGTHYLETSFYKNGQYVTPFIAHYNSAYVIPHGDTTIIEGYATIFDEDSYLTLIPTMLKNGSMVELAINTDTDVAAQGVATNVLINRGKFAYSQRLVDTYTEAVGNTEYILQYFLRNGQVHSRLLRHDYQNYERGNYAAKRVICIPVNRYVDPEDSNYYLTNLEDVQKQTAMYRIKKVTEKWDRFTNTGNAVWYPLEFKFRNTVYYEQKTLRNLYVLQIPVGYENGHNINPDGLEYKRGDIIEVRIISDGVQHQSYMEVVPYFDLIYKQEIVF